MNGIEFLKGHGTQNDFVLLPDLAGELDLTPARVAALCDRRRGLGADGVLRIVRAEAVGAAAAGTTGRWFMDYRNADGSIAEMCGNGVRVFARYLVESGLEPGGRFVVGTRAGDRPVEVHDDLSVTVHMGPAKVMGTSVAIVGASELSGVAVDVGNPHLVATIAEHVAGLDLREAPYYDRDYFPEGVNLEFVNVLGPGALRMRVYERGVGETRSCGTGTVAAVAATLHVAGSDHGSSTVDVPGGRVTVSVERGGESTLTGPAEFVARGGLDAAWWDRQV